VDKELVRGGGKSMWDESKDYLHKLRKAQYQCFYRLSPNS